MEIFNFSQLAFVLIQCIIIASLISLLFRLRNKFGLSLIFIAIGVFQYMQVVLTNNFHFEILKGVFITPGSSVLFSATLFTVLLIYIKEGTFETRKLIYGLVIANIIMSLLQYTFALNAEHNDIFNNNNPLAYRALVFVVGTIILYIDSIFIILLYEFLSKYIKYLPIKMLLTMMVVLSFDAILFNASVFFNSENLSLLIYSDIISKNIIAIVYTILFTILLSFFEKNVKVESLNIIEIFRTLTYRQKYHQSEKEKLKIKDEFTGKLKDQKEKLKATLNSVGDAVITTDKDGIITSINSVACQLTGYLEVNALGETIHKIFNIINEYSREPIRISIDKVLKQGKIKSLSNHTILIAKNNFERPITYSISPIVSFTGLKSGGVLVFRDQTIQRESLSKIKELYERNYKLLESIMDAFILADIEGNIVDVNNSYSKIIGYSKEELLSKNIFELGVNFQKNRIKRLLADLDKKKDLRYQTQHKHKNGQIIYLNSSILNCKK